MKLKSNIFFWGGGGFDKQNCCFFGFICFFGWGRCGEKGGGGGGVGVLLTEVNMKVNDANPMESTNNRV